MLPKMADAKPLATFLRDNLSGRNSRQSQHDARIRHHGVGPFFLGGFSEKLKIILSHLYVHLNCSFHLPCIRQPVQESNVTKSTQDTTTARWSDPFQGNLQL